MGKKRGLFARFRRFNPLRTQTDPLFTELEESETENEKRVLLERWARRHHEVSLALFSGLVNAKRSSSLMAIEALEAVADSAAETMLFWYLFADDHEVSISAASALGRVGRQKAKFLLLRLQDSLHASASIYREGRAAIETIRSGRAQERPVFSRALLASDLVHLDEISADAAAEVLSRYADDQVSVAIGEEAITILSRIGPEAEEALLDFLALHNSTLVKNAASALQQVGSDRSLPALERLVSEKEKLHALFDAVVSAAQRVEGRLQRTTEEARGCLSLAASEEEGFLSLIKDWEEDRGLVTSRRK